MRESIGATWILSIVVVFIALFAAFLAFSVNYAKAYRVKDGIIERIEKYNGWNNTNNQLVKEIDNYLLDIGYNTQGVCARTLEEGTPFIGVTNEELNGVRASIKNDKSKYQYCIQKLGVEDVTTCSVLSAYYKVTVFFSLQIPGIQDYSTFALTGETKTIQYPRDDGDGSSTILAMNEWNNINGKKCKPASGGE